MSRTKIHAFALIPFLLAAVLSGCGGGGGGGGSGGGGVTDPNAPAQGASPPSAAVDGPAWFAHGPDAQHSGQSVIASQNFGRISWSSPVDMSPQYTVNGNLLIHYGSPVISNRNTVVYPVKTGATDTFRIEARAGGNGGLLWWSAVDYRLPPAFNWTPSYNVIITPQGKVVAPGAGGKLLVRDSADATAGAFQNAVFYGAGTYSGSPATFDGSVYINTPLTSDAQGNIFFGFVVTGANPASLVSGIARMGANGVGTWIAAPTAAADITIAKPAMNSAPALSPDGQTLYVAVNTAPVSGQVQSGYLLALDSTTLAVKQRVRLMDPLSGTPARVTDDATSSPAVGPDGRVYFGVLEAVGASHNSRGWLLQYTAQLAAAGVPGSFGWDVTPTIVPLSMVPSYTGPAPYLIAVKYNNYLGRGTGNGSNELALIDPNVAQLDRFSTVNVMREIYTKVGPTFEVGSTVAVKEWCINTMAADVARKSIVVNSEDGILYRWDLTNNTLSQSIRLNNGLGQAYTPTAIGADGAVYAISNARLYSVGQ